jgi:hypothetical protein
MKTVEQKSRRFETITGICLLFVLFFIGAGIISNQFDYDISRYGIVQPKSEFELRSQAPAGYESLSATERYAPETLYEKINGKAPLYLESGFVQLTTQRFINSSEQNLWMEIYLFDMGKAANAFSVFSVQRREDAEAVGIFPVSFGYKTSNGIYFSHGKYNVEMVGSEESENLVAAMEAVAAKLKSGLAVDENEKVTELGLFGKDILVEGSTKLYLNSAFGYEGLRNTFTAKYKVGDENITVFFSKCSDAKEAEELVNSYYDFLIENGYEDSEAGLAGLNGKVVDYYGFKEIVFSHGVYTGGVHESENQESAIQAALILKERINKAK